MLSGKLCEFKKAYPMVFWRYFVRRTGSTYSWINRINREFKENPFYYRQQENSLSTETISILFLDIDAVPEPALAQCGSVTLCWWSLLPFCNNFWMVLKLASFWAICSSKMFEAMHLLIDNTLVFTVFP